MRTSAEVTANKNQLVAAIIKANPGITNKAISKAVYAATGQGIGDPRISEIRAQIAATRTGESTGEASPAVVTRAPWSYAEDATITLLANETFGVMVTDQDFATRVTKDLPRRSLRAIGERARDLGTNLGHRLGRPSAPASKENGRKIDALLELANFLCTQRNGS